MIVLLYLDGILEFAMIDADLAKVNTFAEMMTASINAQKSTII